MKISVVGIGMDGFKTLTAEAKSAVSSAEILVGAKRMLEPFLHLNKTTFCSYDSNEIAGFLSNRTEKSAVILMSGDCGFYSGAKKLSAVMKQKLNIICGISSPVYFCSKTGLEWSEMKFISLHGASSNIAVNVKSNHYCFFLLGGKFTPSLVCKRLCEYGLENTKIYTGENLGYEHEKISVGRAGDFTEISTDNLCCLIAENPDFISYVPCGISDESFIRKAVPMTKSEVRAIIVSWLEINKNDICFDIGCGTGSVSVEMAFRCPDGTVYSIDKNPEAAALTAENARKFGCDNIYPETCDIADFKPDIIPDKVFIGGSGGNISMLIRQIFSLNKSAKIVASAVTLETLNNTLKTFSDIGAEVCVSQISVARTSKTSSFTMLKALNPVFIIKGELP